MEPLTKERLKKIKEAWITIDVLYNYLETDKDIELFIAFDSMFNTLLKKLNIKKGE